MKNRVLLAAAVTLCTTNSTAHVPIVNNQLLEYSMEAPFEVNEPEISTAIFSELRGAAQYYRIEANTTFQFYVGIMQAKLESCGKLHSFSFEVLDTNMKHIDARYGEGFEWWPWYEEFGKTWYWVGPEIGEDFKSNQTYEAGTYWIRVFNADNQGRYVLAIGDIERFDIGTIAGMFVNQTMKKIRSGWWDETLCNKE